MDPLHRAIAIIPLAVYLLLLGLINLSPRAFVTTGIRDHLALALGISGLMIVGPMELFLPLQASFRFGPYVWLMMIALYLLGCTLLVLMSRPRLVIYNATQNDLRPILQRVVKNLDHEATWADDTFVLPQLHVQFHLESFAALKNCSLVSVGPRQSWMGWKTLERELAPVLRQTVQSPNPYGMSLVIFGIALGGITTWWLAFDRAHIAQALRDMLRL